MLPDHFARLLTAYVDGELSARQRKHVTRLLHRSADARALLARLQADATRLRHLPRKRPDRDLAVEVMGTITQLELQPVRPPARVARAPGLAAWAAAASVLLAVGAASYFAFPLFFKKDRPDRQLVKKAPPRTVPPKKAPAARPPEKKLPPPDPDKAPGEFEDPFQPDPLVPDEKPEAAPPDTQPRPKAPEVVRQTPRPEPVVPAPNERVLGSRPNQEAPRVALPNLSFMAPLHQVSEKGSRQRLQAKLHSDDALHVQLLCRDTARGLDQLRPLLAARGFQLLVDADARDRLQKRRIPTKFILYAENISPDELLAVLEQLRQIDRQVAVKNKAPRQFGVVVVSSMSEKFRRQVTRFLEGKRPKAQGPQGADVPRAGTADQVARGPREKGPAKPPTNPGAGKGARRLVLVLAYNEDNSPVRSRPGLSREVKQFRDRRPERRPGTVRVVVELSRDPV